MSYAQRKQLSGNRGVSIFMTVAVVGSLMYAIVTGLAYDVIKKTAENLKVIATARSVTEDLLTDVARQVAVTARPKTYGAGGQIAAPHAPSGGIAVNRAL